MRVWSKNSSNLELSEKFKYFHVDELIEGTGRELNPRPLGYELLPHSCLSWVFLSLRG